MTSSPDTGVAIVGLDHRIQWANPALCKALQYELYELIGRMFEEITHPDDVMLDAHLADRMIAGSLSTYQFAKRYIDKSGAIIPMHLTATVIRDRAGQPLYGLATIEPQLRLPTLARGIGGFTANTSERDRIRNANVM